MEEKSKNPKRVEAGKKLAENNKKIKEFYTKNSKSNYNYHIIGAVTIFSGIGIFYYFYKTQNVTPAQNVTPTVTPVTPTPTRKSKHILYE